MASRSHRKLPRGFGFTAGASTLKRHRHSNFAAEKMGWLGKSNVSREKGAAFFIVLAFVVLLTGLSVAYLSRTTADRQVAHSSFNQSNADRLAASAMDLIIGDLQTEIANGSSPTPTVMPTVSPVP